MSSENDSFLLRMGRTRPGPRSAMDPPPPRTLEALAAREAEARENPPMTPGDFAMDVGASALGAMSGAGAARGLGGGKLLQRAVGAVGGGLGSAAAGQFRGYPPGRAFMEGIAGEAIGQAAEKPAGALARKLGQGMRTVGEATPGLRRLFLRDIGAEDALRVLADEGETLTAGQVTKSDFIRNAEAFLENAVGSRGPLIQTQDRAAEASKRIVGAFYDSYKKLDKQQSGKAIQGMFSDRLDSFRTAASKKFKPVDDAISTSGSTGVVDTSALKAEAQRLIASGVADIRTPQSASSAVLATVAELPDTITFERATNLLSNLGALGRSGTDPIPGQGKRVAGKLASILDAKTQEAADRLTPDLRRQWKEARSFWKTGAADFNDDLIGTILEKQPEDIVEYLVPLDGKTRRSAIERLTKIASTRGEAAASAGDFLDPLRGAVLHKMMKDAGGTEVIYGQKPLQFVDGASLRQQVAAFGEENLVPIFGKPAADRLATLARTLELSQRKASTVGRAVSHLGLPSVLLIQGASGYGIMTTDKMGPAEKAGSLATMFFLGPRALSWALRDPKMVSLIGKGSLAAPGTDAARAVTGQMLSRVMRMQQMFGTEEVRQERGELQSTGPGTERVMPPGYNPERPPVLRGAGR